jgi:hypothetical protein
MKGCSIALQIFPSRQRCEPGKKAATFYQPDERISMMINLEFASQLPLLKGQLDIKKPSRHRSKQTLRLSG